MHDDPFASKSGASVITLDELFAKVSVRCHAYDLIRSHRKSLVALCSMSYSRRAQEDKDGNGYLDRDELRHVRHCS